MEQASDSYSRDREKFTRFVYLISLGWVLLAFVQWLIVNLVCELACMFIKCSWIGFIFFLLSLIMIVIFMLRQDWLTRPWLHWLLAVLIVEFAIIGVFPLVAGPLWPDLIMWFIICLLTISICILLSMVIGRDLTANLDNIAMSGYIVFVGLIFLFMLNEVTQTSHSLILYLIIIGAIILTFVMYHAQTINGGRFAELRITNYLMATFMLFYFFVLLLLPTIVLQIKYKIASKALINIGLVDESIYDREIIFRQ